MKTSHFLTLSIGSSILATGLYMGSPDTTRSNDTQPKVSTTIAEKRKDMWEILNTATERPNASIQVIPSERDQLITLVDTNPTLKMRIQSMSWYRDFLSWKYAVEDIKKNITDALLLEETIKSDPSILMWMQYRDMWRDYLRGSIPPHNIVYGEIPAMLSIDEFSKKNPNIFSQIQKNPMFQKTMDNKEPTFSEQKSIIEWILAQEKTIQENSTLRSKFEQYGYTQSSIYTSDWRDGNQSGFFAINDAIYTLEDPKNFDPIVWKQFQDSDIGMRYRSGSIDPKEAFRYINELAVKMYQ